MSLTACETLVQALRGRVYGFDFDDLDGDLYRETLVNLLMSGLSIDVSDAFQSSPDRMTGAGLCLPGPSTFLQGEDGGLWCVHLRMIEVDGDIASIGDGEGLALPNRKLKECEFESAMVTTWAMGRAKKSPVLTSMVEKSRWIVSGSGFLCHPGSSITILSEYLFGLNEDGDLVGDAIMEASPSAVHYAGSEALARNVVYTLFAKTVFALSLLNCKNIQLVDGPPRPRVPRERGKPRPPRISYKLLHLRPLKEVARVELEGEPEPDLPKKRMHICRGHFRDYRKGKGLFGRLNGRFYSPQHIRGDVSAGKVEKDYKLETE